MKKEKVSLFEKPEITNREYAQKTYDQESAKFKFKLICAGLSLLTSLGWLLQSVLGDSQFASILTGILLLIGFAATIISSPITLIKTAFKLVRFGWYIVPFALVDLFGAAVGAMAAIALFGFAPVVYCVIGLYQSYLSKKEAERFLYSTPVEATQDVESTL